MSWTEKPWIHRCTYQHCLHYNGVVDHTVSTINEAMGDSYESTKELKPLSAMLSYIRQRDERAFLLINQRFHNSFITFLMKRVTHLGSMPFVFVLLFVVGILPVIRETSLQEDLALRLLVSHSIVQLIKVTVHRKRPFCQLEKVFSASVPACQYSFPSGHTNAAFVTAFTLSAYYPGLKGLFLITAFLVAVSRIYLGVHYPADTIVGTLIAYLVTTGFSAWILFL